MQNFLCCLGVTYCIVIEPTQSLLQDVSLTVVLWYLCWQYVECYTVTLTMWHLHWLFVDSDVDSFVDSYVDSYVGSWVGHYSDS